MQVINDLFDYGLKIVQDKDYFKFSLDSLLLSEFVEIEKSDKRLLDLCSGNAPLPLIVGKNHNIEKRRITSYYIKIISWEIIF